MITLVSSKVLVVLSRENEGASEIFKKLDKLFFEDTISFCVKYIFTYICYSFKEEVSGSTFGQHKYWSTGS